MEDRRPDLQPVSAALSALERDERFEALLYSDKTGYRFRQEAGIAAVLSRRLQPGNSAPELIRERLGWLHTHAVGSLAVFRPFIERAQLALPTA